MKGTVIKNNKLIYVKKKHIIYFGKRRSVNNNKVKFEISGASGDKVYCKGHKYM